MVSRPSLHLPSASVEKTGSRSGFGRNAASQSGLSRAASAAITSQSSVAEELANRLDRPVDLVVAVRERDEHRLELRRGDVDAALEQAPEERGVPIRVAFGRLLKVLDGFVNGV